MELHRLQEGRDSAALQRGLAYLLCSRAAPAEEHTLSDGRKRRRRRDVREQGVALALGKHARQVEPGPSAAAGYAALRRFQKVCADKEGVCRLLNLREPSLEGLVGGV